VKKSTISILFNVYVNLLILFLMFELFLAVKDIVQPNKEITPLTFLLPQYSSCDENTFDLRLLRNARPLRVDFGPYSWLLYFQVKDLSGKQLYFNYSTNILSFSNGTLLGTTQPLGNVVKKEKFPIVLSYYNDNCERLTFTYNGSEKADKLALLYVEIVRLK